MLNIRWGNPRPEDVDIFMAEIDRLYRLAFPEESRIMSQHHPPLGVESLEAVRGAREGWEIKG